MSNAIELVNMESKAEQEMAPIMARATAFIVKDEQTYVDADQIITEVRAKVKALEPELSPTKEAATRAWKAAVALFKKYVDDPLEACRTLDRKRTAWKREEDARRQAESDRLRREEEKRQAEERLALATRMEAAGMVEQAEKIIDAPVAPVNVPEPAKVETPKGQTIIDHWVARIIDPDRVPREFCEPSQVKLNKLATMMGRKAVCEGVVFENVGIVRRKA
jgi:hypothetical protein